MPKKASPAEEAKRQLEDLVHGRQIPCKDEEGPSCGELLGELIRASLKHVLQDALEKEVAAFVGKDWGSKDKDRLERTAMRNGYEPAQVRMAEGRVKLALPQTRGGAEPFRSSLMPVIRSRSHQLEKLAIEGYARGLSTRDVEATFTDQDGTALITKDQISELTEVFNAEYEAFRQRDLSSFDVIYLFADAVYESLRKQAGCKEGIFVAWAILADGRKMLLSVALGVHESASAWEDFFRDMIRRGLRQPLLVATDGGAGLIAASDKVFHKSKRQRCIAHKLRNISNKLPKNELKALLPEFRAPFYAPSRKLAGQMVDELTNKYSARYPEAVRCLLDDLECCLTHLSFPAGHQRFIRTTNLLERVFVEQRRRTRIIPGFDNERSCLKIVFATLFRVSESWRCVNMSDIELTALRHLRTLMWGDLNFTTVSIPYIA
jgi:transposase-like protein